MTDVYAWIDPWEAQKVAFREGEASGMQYGRAAALKEIAQPVVREAIAYGARQLGTAIATRPEFVEAVEKVSSIAMKEGYQMRMEQSIINLEEATLTQEVILLRPFQIGVRVNYRIDPWEGR